MKLFNLMLIPRISASAFCRKFKERMILHAILRTAKLAFIVAIAVFFLLEYFSPFAQTSLGVDLPDKIGEFLSFSKITRDPTVQEVLNLANMIRLITDDQLSESKVLRYAGLIYQASQKYGVNPREIIASNHGGKPIQGE